MSTLRPTIDPGLPKPGVRSWFAKGATVAPTRDRGAVDRIYRQTRKSVLLSVALGYGFLYTCGLPLSVIKGPLINEGLFDAETLGRVGAAFAVGYAIGKALGGMIMGSAIMPSSAIMPLAISSA